MFERQLPRSSRGPAVLGYAVAAWDAWTDGAVAPRRRLLVLSNTGKIVTPLLPLGRMSRELHQLCVVKSVHELHWRTRAQCCRRVCGGVSCRGIQRRRDHPVRWCVKFLIKPPVSVLLGSMTAYGLRRGGAASENAESRS